MLTIKNSNAGERGQFYRRAIIDVLPDEVLLEIFNFYVNTTYPVDGWRMLVQVCRRWRRVVFASPRRLNLRLLCTGGSPVKKLLDIWPALPIVIKGKSRQWGVNLLAALEHNDRICEIIIDPTSSRLLRRLLRQFAAMTKPFTALTHLRLLSNNGTTPVIPDSFLGGSAPRLRTLSLDGIPFPGLTKLLLSAHDLVDLDLWDIPQSGYIPPEAMVTALSSLTSLESLRLRFRSPRPLPDQITQHLAPFTRTVLPALTFLSFKGISEYLEVLVSRIDVPLLNSAYVTFFNQIIYHTSLLRHFISYTEALEEFRRASIRFSHSKVEVTLWSAHNGVIELGISCEMVDRQLSSLAQVCNSSLPPLPTLERLDILGWRKRWDYDVENTQLLEVLQPFTAVKNLYLDKNLAPRVAPALRELTRESVADLLPMLQNIFVEELQSSEPVQEAIAQFVSVRPLLGHPVAVRNWNGRLWE